MAPTIGIVGVAGCVLITTFADANEVHPTELVTVKLQVPAARFGIVALAVEPVIAPGLIVQLPSGKQLNTTLPVAIEHVGWVIVPTAGVAGAAG